MQLTAYCKGQSSYGLLTKTLRVMTSSEARIHHAMKKNIIRVMKLTALILLVSCLHVTASGLAQNVTFSGSNVSLKKVFSVIKEQTGFFVFVNAELLKDTKPVTLSVKNLPLNQFLGIVLNDQGLDYSIKENTIVISREPLTTGLQPSASTYFSPPITGVVRDGEGRALEGASVKLKGTNTGTATDVNGSFALQIPEGGGILIISYVGYETVELPVSKEEEVKIVLKSKGSNVEEVVVVGYGRQKKVSLTSAVSQIKGDEITKRTVSSIEQGLQGLAPGITVLDRGGSPGRSNASVRVRGLTTFNIAAEDMTGGFDLSKNDALVIVDGIEQRLTDINPVDIETISILKDASSTAIYGSRATNGVILITTKRAKEGRVVVNYNGYYALQKSINNPEMMDLESYMRMQVVAYTNAGATVPARYTEESIQAWITATDREKYPLPNTWYQTMLRTAPQTSHSVAVAGGNDMFKARLSVRYQDQQGILPNFDNKIREIRVNTDYNVSKKIKVSADANYRYNYSITPYSPFEVYQRMLHGTLWAVPKYADGTYGLSPGGFNPLMYAELAGTAKQYTDYVIGNVKGDWEIVNGLNLSAQYSARMQFISQKNFRNAFTNTDKNTNNTHTVNNNTLTEVRNSLREYTLNTLLAYEKEFGNHDVKALAGYSEIYNRQNSISAYRERFFNNDVQSLQQGTNDGTRNNDGTDGEFGLKSYFGRINYAYDNKYLFEANARYDGSSKFIEGKQYGFFPSFSAGWRISQEAFWDNLINTVNEFKIRGSWGKTGNQAVSLYSYYDALTTVPYTFGGTPAQGYRQTSLSNEDLSWESTTQTDIGLDAQLFRGRVNVTIDYYRKLTEQILMNLPISAIVGLPAPPQNAGSVENKGWEFAISYRNGNEFRYDIGANFSMNKNEVVSLAKTGPYIVGPDIDPRFIIQEGLPINAMWGYLTDGLFQTEDEINRYGVTYAPNTKPGDVKYVDRNGDGMINGDDMTVIGLSFPKYIFGLTANLGYKNFELSMLFQGAAKADTRLAGALSEMGNQEGFTHKIYTNDYWTPENPNARFPRPVKFDFRNVATSDRWVFNGSYVRLKNIQLAYNLPVKFISNVNMSRASVYIAATNLLTISKLNEWNIDPEAESGRLQYYPQTGLYTFGVNIQF